MSGSESKKHRDFVNEPMGNKAADHLPGIGRVTCDRLRDHGIDSASGVMGQYLDRQGNQTAFQGYMQGTAGARQDHASQTYNALNGQKTT